MNWMMDVHTDEFGYEEIDPPYLVKQETMIGSGNLPKFKDNLYRDDETDLWLIPTAEVSLNGLHQGKIMPRRVTGTSAKMHRNLVRAIKRSRSIALMPYVEKGTD